MADHFEKAMQDILLRADKNGGPTIRDVLTALAALADDQDEQHAESVEATKHNRELLETHCVEAVLRDERIGVLEAWRSESARTCVERMTAIAKEVQEELHEVKHADHMASCHAPRREDDPPGETHWSDRHMEPLDDETRRQTWFMWTIGGKLGYLIVAAIVTLINIGLNYLWFGRP